MSFGEHLEELRWRIILALLGPVVTCLVTLYFGRQIVAWLVIPLARALRSLGEAPQTYFLSPAGGFAVYLKVSIVAGIVLASPWMVYQIWKFVQAGLYQHERRVAITILPFSTLMAALGVVFLYYVMLPVCLVFLLTFASNFPAPTMNTSGEGDPMRWLTDLTGAFSGGRDVEESPGPEVAEGSPPAPVAPAALAQIPVLAQDPPSPGQGDMWIYKPLLELRVFFDGQIHSFVPLGGRSLVQPMMEVGQYIHFVVMLALGLIIAFQLPVVMLIFGWTGVVQPALVSRYRKYGVFACFAVGAIFTPADPISMFVLAMPLWGLFEVGLLLMRLTYRARAVAPEEMQP